MKASAAVATLFRRTARRELSVIPSSRSWSQPSG